jgi:uncharacterized protein YdhG (YjbR/CyaY superfamily)
MSDSVKPKNVDEYIAGFPDKTQYMLKELRAIIRKIVPAADEGISYGIPTFYLNGHYLIYFAGYKKHVSIYPASHGSEAFEKAVAPHKSGKGTFQFPLSEALPTRLIEMIVKERLKEFRESKK